MKVTIIDFTEGAFVVMDNKYEEYKSVAWVHALSHSWPTEWQKKTDRPTHIDNDSLWNSY